MNNRQNKIRILSAILYALAFFITGKVNGQNIYYTSIQKTSQFFRPFSPWGKINSPIDRSPYLKNTSLDLEQRDNEANDLSTRNPNHFFFLTNEIEKTNLNLFLQNYFPHFIAYPWGLGVKVMENSRTIEIQSGIQYQLTPSIATNAQNETTLFLHNRIQGFVRARILIYLK